MCLCVYVNVRARMCGAGESPARGGATTAVPHDDTRGDPPEPAPRGRAAHAASLRLRVRVGVGDGVRRVGEAVGVRVAAGDGVRYGVGTALGVMASAPYGSVMTTRPLPPVLRAPAPTPTPAA